MNEWYPFGGDNECYNNSLADYQNLQLGYHLTEGKQMHNTMGYYIYCSIGILEFYSLVSSLLTINLTLRPLISEIRFHSWMTDCPSIRPSWYGTSDKYTIQTCLPSYLHNVKLRHLCTSQSSSCKNAVAPYVQSSMEEYSVISQYHQHGVRVVHCLTLLRLFPYAGLYRINHNQ